MVTDATRDRVLEAVQHMGFIPNGTAKSLRSRRSRKLLVTVPDLSNPFFSVILQGIEEAAQRAGYSVLVGDTQNDDVREERYAKMLEQREADGLIFLGPRLPKTAAAVVYRAMPRCAPVVNGCEFSEGMHVPSVHIDNEKAAIDAMEYLHKLGHRRLSVVIGPLDSPVSRDRLAGAMRVAKKHRTTTTCLVEQGDFSVESGAAAGVRLLTQTLRPTAVFCFNDEMAMGLLQAAAQLSLRVPRDVSVVGFDDIRFARCVQPPLTTVAQPMRAIGEGAVELLLKILESGGERPTSVTLPHTLTIRSSTGPAPGGEAELPLAPARRRRRKFGL